MRELDDDCRNEYTDRLHQVAYDVYECRANIQVLDVVVGVFVVIVDAVHRDRYTGLEACGLVLKVCIKLNFVWRNHAAIKCEYDLQFYDHVNGHASASGNATHRSVSDRLCRSEEVGRLRC